MATHLFMSPSASHSRAGPICTRPRNPNDPTRRTVFTDIGATVYGWPSRGLIILEDATHVDFTFLGLSTIDPLLKREHCHNPNDKDGVGGIMAKEDSFCQRLLLSGAKWWDSEARDRFLTKVRAGDPPAIGDI